MAVTIDGTNGITTPAESVTGTGVWSVGGSQIYKDASGNVGIGTSSIVSPARVDITKATTNNSIATQRQLRVGGDTSASYSLFIGYGQPVTGEELGGNIQALDNGVGSKLLLNPSGGNVGIGTSSPLGKFEVASGRSTFTGSSEPFSIGVRYNNTGGRFYVGAASASATPDLVFSAATGDERMRVTSSGNLLVGKTAVSSSKFEVAAATEVASFQNTGGTGTIRFYNSAASTIGYIQWSGSTTSYVTSSDYRLKNTIAPMTGALDKVALLKPVTYKWIVDGSDGQGFIAHELAEVEPGCVTGEKDAVDAEGKPRYQGIDTSFLVATLTAAIQEQQAIIQSLTTRITALEAK